MNTIHCLLIDDEPPAITLLERYIGMIDQLNIVGTSNSAVKAFDLLHDKQIDLIFLDIQMPVLNGIEFVKTLKNPPAVILTTAYREYAVEGYDIDIIDYLLKPISFERFIKSVERYRERNTTNFNPKGNTQPGHIFLNVNRSKTKFIFEDILYIESLKDYVRIHTKTDRLVVKGNLGTVLKLFPSDQFFRIHRSYAIARNKVHSYNQSEIEIEGYKLPIGTSYRKDIEKLFKED